MPGATRALTGPGLVVKIGLIRGLATRSGPPHGLGMPLTASCRCLGRPGHDVTRKKIRVLEALRRGEECVAGTCCYAYLLSSTPSCYVWIECVPFLRVRSKKNPTRTNKMCTHSRPRKPKLGTRSRARLKNENTRNRKTGYASQNAYQNISTLSVYLLRYRYAFGYEDAT